MDKITKKITRQIKRQKTRELIKKIIPWGAFVLLFFLVQEALQAIIVGSKSASSSQAFTLFPAADTNNTLLGFASFDNGFALADATTTATFDNYQVVNELINLNGGRLVLRQDCFLAARTRFLSGGVIQGYDHAFILPEQQETLTLPLIPTAAFENASTIALESVCAADILSLDWSTQSLYLASGQGTITGPELKLYAFNGVTLTTTRTIEIGRTVNSVRWHPSQLFCATGLPSGTGNNIRIYRYTISNGQFTEISGAALAGSINATYWHPSGNYLVLGRTDNTQEITVYTVSNGILGTSYSVNLASDQDINRDALTFSPGGNQVAFGLTNKATTNISELMLYNFSASSLTLTSSLDTGANLQSLDWSPTGSYIIAALTGSSQNIRLYDASQGPVREVLSSRQTESRNAFAASWHPSGNYATVSVATGSASQTLLYFFDRINQQLTYLTAFPTITQTLAHRWSRNGSFLAYGAQTAATTFSLNLASFTSNDPQLLCENTTLVCNSDVSFAADFQFKGSCRINGSGKKISFNQNADCIVRPGSSLVIENARLESLRQNNLRCLSPNSSITLRNVILSFDRDFTFSQGSLSCEGTVLLTGTTQFNYTSGITSTIRSNSSLYLTNGLRFIYNPTQPRRNLLYCENRTSELYLMGASLVTTRTGLDLTQGTLTLDDAVTLSSGALYPAEALYLSNNLDIKIRGGATLNVEGLVRYE